MHIGSRIRQARLFKRMTQSELCQGISSIAYLSQVETNAAKPSAPFIQKIAERLGASPELLTESYHEEMGEQLYIRFKQYWAEDIFTEETGLLLHIYAEEMLPNRIYLMIYSMLIRYHNLRTHLKEAKQYYEKSIQLLRLDDPSAEKELFYYYYLSAGVLFWELTDFNRANQFFFRCELLSEAVGEREKARLCYNLSLLNQRINEDKTVSLHYSGRACEHLKASGDKKRLIQLLTARAIQFLLVNREAEAMQCLAEAEQYAGGDDPDVVSGMHYNYGRVYQLTGKFAEAEECFLQALRVLKHYPHDMKIMNSYKRLIELYIEQKNWVAVDEVLQSAYAILHKNKEVVFDVELYRLAIKLHKIKADYQRYEKELQKLIDRCIELKLFHHVKTLAAELGTYYFEKKAYKKSSQYLLLAQQYEPISL
ncbi:helix-turn-helix domain-containing protein [Paenibacillus turpanensis]|uniref:helix-turn-helix domain-containing protein n=1 Tax=Paenibacillus turpanensis TaxID=2689078 RepID=UPI00140AA541|nr:helix-turn-helix transcriptional regulator [Paenibacillus turpanensis]